PTRRQAVDAGGGLGPRRPAGAGGAVGLPRGGTLVNQRRPDGPPPRGGRGRRTSGPPRRPDTRRPPVDDPARAAALEVLAAVRERGAYANLALPSVLDRRHLTGRDAAL